jgi:hypothetical protein
LERWRGAAQLGPGDAALPASVHPLRPARILLERKALRQRIAKISRHEGMDIRSARLYLNGTTQRTIRVPFQKDFGNGP